MKTALIAFALTLAANTHACIGEAQLHPTKVLSMIKSQNDCKAFIGNSWLDHNPFCPLDEGRLYSGIKVDCAVHVGDEISGVVVDNGTSLVLE